MKIPETSVNSPRKIKRIWIVIALVTVLSVLMLAWLITSPQSKVIQNLGDSWVLRENQTGSVIGDLGGVPVSIPKPYAHFVEYDGDPHFMEERKGSAPKRTYASRLASFGFEIRYPDMAPLTSETEPQKKEENIYTTTWMRVGVDSNANYGSAGDGFLEARVAAIPSGHTYRYEKLPDQIYGLVGYTPTDADKSRRGYGTLVDGKVADVDDKNIYFYRNQDGKVDAYLECSNMLHEAATCKLRFNMLPVMRAHVSVRFRKGLLPDWRKIQSSVTEVILGFRMNPSSTATTQKGK